MPASYRKNFSILSGLSSFFLFFLLFIILFPLNLSAQSELEFERITVLEGLPQNTVIAILQDSIGFMWFGTSDGLCQYDGYSLKTFRHNPRDTNSLSTNSIWALLEDRNGLLWIGTRNRGINCYDRITHTFRRYQHSIQNKQSISNDIIRFIFQDRQGRIWVGTDNGFNRFDPEKEQFTRYYHDSLDRKSISSNFVRCMLQDHAGNLWIGTNNGLNLFDPSRGIFTRYAIKAPPENLSRFQEIVSITEDNKRKRFWIGTSGGAVLFSPETGESSPITLKTTKPVTRYIESRIYPIEVDDDGWLWMGSEASGLLHYNPTTQELYQYKNDQTNPKSMSSEKVSSMFREKSGSLFIGTLDAGVNKLDRSVKRFTRIDGSMIMTVCEDHNGDLWLGSWGDGLTRINRKSGSVKHYYAALNDPNAFASNDIRALVEDNVGNLWISSRGAGLYRLSPDRKKLTQFKCKPGNRRTLQNDEVWTIYKDRSGIIWIGTNGGGFSRYNSSDDSFTTYQPPSEIPKELSYGVVHAIYEDRKGNFWIGTVDGLFLFDRSTALHRRYGHSSNDRTSLSNNDVMCIAEDRTGSLWIGTRAGVNRARIPQTTEYDALEFQSYTTEDGLPNDVVYGILEDENGFLWMSTNRGIVKFDPVSETFRCFNKADGLQGDEFNAGAYVKTKDGELLFGGINGVTCFYPHQIAANPYVPAVVLTSYRKYNQEVPLNTDLAFLNSITIEPGEEMVTLIVAALSYNSPEKNRYAYTLKGAFDRWIDLGTSREIHFARIDPGTYELHVRGSNEDGVWNEAGLKLTIDVKAPFWHTAWFRVIGGIALLGILFIGHRLRLRIIERRNKELQKEIDQRRQVEHALKQAESQYRNIFERAQYGIYQSTFDGKLLNVNPALATIYGYHDPAQMISEITDSASQIYVDPHDRESKIQTIQKDGEIHDFTFRQQRRDGSIIWVHDRVRTVLNEEGKPLYLEGFVDDITERRVLEEQLSQAQKMESIGRLAGGIAHDFNNMLTVILGYSEMAASKVPTSARDSIDGIRLAAERAQHMTNQLLAFARRQVIRPEICSLNTLINDLQSILRRLVGEDIQVIFQPSPHLWLVSIDPTQFEQVIINLAANARDAMPNGGKLFFETRNVDLNEDYTKSHSEVTPGSYAVVSVSDTGVGIPEEMRTNIFEPFFTTKERGKGTGLGLATVLGIVKQSQGHIFVYSEPNKGTTFKIYFPRAKESEEQRAKLEIVSLPRGSETILVVDDEEMVLELAVDVFQESGYTVLSARRGKEALELVRNYSGEIHLLMTDVVMPEMSGKQLAEEIRILRPEIKVLYASGFTENVIVHHGVVEPEVNFLQKPFTPTLLLRTVRAILENRPAEFH